MVSLKKQPVKFSKEDVEIISQKELYRGFFSLDLCCFKHRLFSGKMSNEISREVFRRKNAAVLLLFDPKLDQVVLIEQIRIAVLNNSNTPWLLELVAGTIEENETPEQAARREAIEESGFIVGRIKRVISCLSSPGGTSERLSIMIGEVDTNLVVENTYGLTSEDENIRTHILSRKQAFSLVEEGKIDNASSIIALQWLQLNYRKLIKEWKNPVSDR